MRKSSASLDSNVKYVKYIQMVINYYNVCDPCPQIMFS